jgi:hypothetical protein
MVGIGKDGGGSFLLSLLLVFVLVVTYSGKKKKKENTLKPTEMKMLSNNIKYKTKNTSDIRRTTFIIYINHLSSIWTRDYLQ